jgi:hypothetical protein
LAASSKTSPHRDKPLARQSLGRARELMAHLFDALHLEERVND